VKGGDGLAADVSFRNTMARGSWDFALPGIALVLQFENENVSAARIVLGEVVPHPWRVHASVNLIANVKLEGEKAAKAAVSGAAPLRDNAYKVQIVKGYSAQLN
jgi:xanthine dehydrogenase YagS FAD-binding subunit